MDTLIEQLKEKIKMCGDATREDRARKGVYVDVLQMVRQAVVVKPTLSDGWREAWDGLPADGDLVLICYDHGDRYSYEVRVWSCEDTRFAKMNSIHAWRTIEPPAFA